MSYFQIVFDSLVDTAGFCTVLFGIFVVLHTRKPVLKFFLWFIASLLIVNLCYFLHRLLEISQPAESPAFFQTLNFIIIIFYTVGLFFSTMTIHFVLCRALNSRWSRVYLIILSCIFILRLATDLTGNKALDRILPRAVWGSFSDSYFIWMGLCAFIMLLIYFPRLSRSALRSFCLSLIFITGIEILVEIFSVGMPGAFWKYIGLPPYFSGMSLLMVFIFILAFRFLLHEYRLTEKALPGSHSSPAGEQNGLWTQYHLSEREKEVASGVLAGLSNKEIAGQLCISLATVKTHVHNILNKTGCTKRISLITLANKRTAGTITDKPAPGA